MSQRDHDLDRRQFLERIAMTAGAAGVIGLGTRVAAAQAPEAAPAAAPAAPAANPGGAPMKDVAGKVAFITGASSGIGLGQARVFHRAGMKVAIGYIRDDQLEEAMKQFTSDQDRVIAIKADVTDRDAMKRAADQIEAKWGKIHLLSNNAGVGMASSVGTCTTKDFDWTIAVNLVGVFNGIHEFLPRIRRHGEGGHIVTTSSMSGLLPTEGGGAGVYTTTKFASIGMMEGLRAELDARKDNIGASVYTPGFVNTNIFEVEKNRPAAFANNADASGEAANKEAAQRESAIRSIAGVGMDPIEAAEIVLRGIRNNDLFILSHPEFAAGVRERNEALELAVPKGQAPAARVAAVGATLHNSLYVREREKRLGRKA